MEDSDQSLLPEPAKPSKTSSFLGCFGFSRRKKPVVLERNRSLKVKKKKWFISWRAKQSAVKTVPVDTANGTVSDQKIFSDVKSKKKKRCKSLEHKVSSNGKTTRQIPVEEDDVADHEESKHRPLEITSEVEEKIITENRDSTSDQMKSPKEANNTLQKQFFRKIDAIRAGQSQPGSPDTKPKSNRPSSVSRSATMALTNHQKPVRTKSFNKPKKTNKENQEIKNNKFEPVIGMSIIMVTLVIVLFWGRLCAILCTSAWFYFIPRFRTGSDQTMNNHGSIMGEPDLDSDEYKKRVVLEGLLERNRRSVM